MSTSQRREKKTRVGRNRKEVKQKVLPKGWREVKIIDFSPLQRGFDLPIDQIKDGAYPVVYSNGIKNYHSEYKSKAPGVVTGRSGTIGEVTYVSQDYWPHNTSLWVTDFKGNYPRFVFYSLKHLRMHRLDAGSGVPTLNRNDVHKQSILVPPLPEQKAIASLLEKWDTAIEKTEALIAAKEKQFKRLLKRLLSDQQNNPKWRKVRLGSLLSYEQPTKYIVDSTNYTDKGSVAVLTANKSFILGYTEEKSRIFDEVPVIIFDDFTTANRYVDFPFKVKSSAIKILRRADNSLNLKFVYYSMQFIDFPLGGHQRYWISEYQYLELRLPPLAEQKKIVNVLDTTQKEIDLLKRFVKQYRTQKRGLMHKLLTGKWRIK